MNAHTLTQPHSEPVEFHTDAPANAEELAIAFEAFLPVTGGDKAAAATLAGAAIIAEALIRASAR